MFTYALVLLFALPFPHVGSGLHLRWISFCYNPYLCVSVSLSWFQSHTMLFVFTWSSFCAANVVPHSCRHISLCILFLTIISLYRRWSNSEISVVLVLLRVILCAFKEKMFNYPNLRCVFSRSVHPYLKSVCTASSVVGEDRFICVWSTTYTISQRILHSFSFSDNANACTNKIAGWSKLRLKKVSKWILHSYISGLKCFWIAFHGLHSYFPLIFTPNMTFFAKRHAGIKHNITGLMLVWLKYEGLYCL